MNTYFSGIDFQRPMAADQSFPGLICAPARLHPDRSSKQASYRRITHNSLYGNAHLGLLLAPPQNLGIRLVVSDRHGIKRRGRITLTPLDDLCGCLQGAHQVRSPKQPLSRERWRAAMRTNRSSKALKVPPSEAAEIGGHRAAWPAPNKTGWVACSNCA